MTDLSFACVCCGVECPIAPDPPEWPVCEDCCPDHEYQYDTWRRGRYCLHCDKQQEESYDG